MTRKRIVCFDFETTGLDFLKDQPIEYAAVSIELDGTIKSIHGFVKFDGELSDMVKQLTNLDIQTINTQGDTYDVAMTKLIEFIGIKEDIEINDTILVGHNMLNFDIHFLDLACAKLGYDIVNPNNYWDTAGCYKASKLNLIRNTNESISEFHRRALSTYAKGLKFKLPIVCEALGIDFKEDHRASSDTMATLKVFQKQATEFHSDFLELLK